MCEHVCSCQRCASVCVLLSGGRGVIEEIEKQLALTHDLMQPSKDTLHRHAPLVPYMLLLPGKRAGMP